jgi:hypothetical protein
MHEQRQAIATDYPFVLHVCRLPPFGQWCFSTDSVFSSDWGTVGQAPLQPLTGTGLVGARLPLGWSAWRSGRHPDRTGLWEESAHAQEAHPMRPRDGRRRSLCFCWRGEVVPSRRRHVLAMYGTMTL